MLPLDPARHIVTAVVVTHDGARWLPQTLEALRSQTRPVQRVVGVDTGSRDRSGSILGEYIAPESILTLPRDTSYGAAVQAALDHPRSHTEFPAADGATEWVWLVHDDCTPEPDALKQLLRAAEDNPRAAVLGPKLRDWFDRRLLLEVGVTIDGAGRRETGLEVREFDHGQHDGNRQVLAVSSAGMLVRRDVWEALGGFDPSLRLFRDDIDFCWRVGGAGHRVLIVTDAVAYHAEAAARRRRRIHATGDHPRRVDRRNALYVLLANLPFGAMLVALLRNSFASALRVLTYLVAKQPANALDEAVAITSVFFVMPFRLTRARVRRRKGRSRTYSAIRPFMAHGVAMRQFTDAVSNLLGGDAAALDTAGRHQAVTVAPTADDDDPLRDDAGLLRRALTNPAVLLVIGLTAVALVAERSLLAGGRLAGGALPPVWGGASDLWAMYTASWHDVGVGSDAAAPPYLGVLALLSTLALGKPWLAVTAILLGCVPLAGFTAYQLARRVLRYRPAQLWMAASYALLPVATGAVAQGRIGTALVHALFPVLGLLATSVLTLPPRRSRRAAWALGLVLALATAFVPLVWPLALLTAVLIGVAFGHLGRRLYVSLAIGVGVPLLLLLPWTPRLFTHPSLWLLEAGINRPEILDTRLSAEALLLLSPGGPGLPPIWVTGGFVAAALGALLLRRRRMLVAMGWCTALVGILIAIVLSRLRLTPLPGGEDITAWPGVALAFAATAMLLSAAAAAQSFSDLWALGGIRRLFAAAVTLLALTTPVTAAGLWMWHGVSGPLTGDAPPTLPPFLESVSADGTQPRTLVVSPDDSGGTVAYSVLRGRAPRLGEPQIPVDAGLSAELDGVVAALVAGRGGDEAAVLAEFGIRYVLVPAPEVGDTVDRTLVDTVDALPGVQRLQLTDEFALWRLLEETGRLRVVPDGDGPPTVLQSGPVGASVDVPAGAPGRRLLLAEPADGGWRATLDGAELTGSETELGMQEFALPADGGRLEVTRTGFSRRIWLTVQGALFLLVALLALPGARTEEDEREQDTRPIPRPRRPRRARRRGRAAEGTRRADRGHRGGRRARQRGSSSR